MTLAIGIECDYAECHNAEFFFHFPILILSVIMLSVIMLDVIMLDVIMLSVIMLDVVIVSVVAPLLGPIQQNFLRP